MSAKVRQCDVVVVGSGGAGLVAACAAADRGAKVMLLEAADLFGGVTALSGGQIWIPDNPVMHRAGYPDSRADALCYLRQNTLGTASEAHLSAFLDNGPRLAQYLEDLGMPLQAISRHDYHPHWPGARAGRSLEPLPVSTAALGELRGQVRTSSTRGPLTSTESRRGLDPQELLARRNSDIRTQGAGLVAGLVAAALARGVALLAGHRVISLTRTENDTFSVVARVSDGSVDAFEAGSVVLASGGFAENSALRGDFLPPVQMLPTAVAGSFGDAFRLALPHGAHLAGMSEAWWTAATTVPADPNGVPAVHRNLVRELAYPGSVLVNASGARFVDEASSYNDLGKAFLRFDPTTHRYPNECAWLVFDAAFKSRYAVAGVAPDMPAPGWFASAPDLGSLAEQVGIDPAGLIGAVAAMADHALRGEDPDFGRGGDAHDAYNGDGTHRPNPCLGTLDTAPYFAIEISLGLNGTKGGLVTDPAGAVLDVDNKSVPGLFACGEAAAALMGPGYAGSGASLGPALTVGLLVGERLGISVTEPPDVGNETPQESHTASDSHMRSTTQPMREKTS
ncbi:FAD-dependent oxidoreductase [Kribbella sp. CA-245084]|uniref:FAD-dependent oxidoreductase n=1 Tax=Kribbella sp. CA-245084 TaxID=3239940 RepID=UPI003D8C4B62